MGHMETLWDDECRLYREEHFPLSTFLAILTIEEIGKLGRLWQDLMGWDIPDKVRGKISAGSAGHHKKHFMGVMAGAIVNSRLDRIVGAKRIKQLLQDVESGELERLRQACLYIDMREGKVVLPEDLVDSETAQFYAVVAGELWAEVLGHVPWEFERMNKKVTDFEIEVGMPEELVKRF